MRQGKAKYVFPGSNTPKGFHSFYPEGLKGLQRIFILKGGPGTGKSTLMRKIGIAMLERGYDVEFWQCSSDNDSLDGVILPALSVGVIDGTAPHNVDPAYPGAVDEIVNLGDHWNDAYLRNHKKEIIETSQAISGNFGRGYRKLAEAGELLEEWRAQNRGAVDEQKLAETTTDLIAAIFRENLTPTRHLFSSAVTPRGLLSFAEAISRNQPLRYILVGPPGCGKEALLARIAAHAEEHGQRMEVYHSTFDTAQIELLVLPDLGTAVLDGGLQTKDSYPAEQVIDFRRLRQAESAENPGTAEIAAEAEIEERFRQIVEAAAADIANAKALHDELEVIYRKAMDFESVDETGNRLFNKILALAAEQEK